MHHLREDDVRTPYVSTIITVIQKYRAFLRLSTYEEKWEFLIPRKNRSNFSCSYGSHIAFLLE